MTPVPAFSWENRTSLDLGIVSANRHLVFRVQEHHTLSHTRLDERDGLSPRIPAPDDWSPGARGAEAIMQCVKWKHYQPTPFISLTRSIGWAIREASVRHYEREKQNELRKSMGWTSAIEANNVEIIFIHANILAAVRPRGTKLFDAASLVKDAVWTDHPPHHADWPQMALNFAQHSDELLVLGGVPSQAIIARVSITDLVHHLPSYFLDPNPDVAPPYGCSPALLPGFYRRVENVPTSPTQFGETKKTFYTYISVYSAMIANLPPRDIASVNKQLQSAVDFTLCMFPPTIISSPTHPYSAARWTAMFTTVAMSILTWLVKWEDLPFDTTSPLSPTMLVYLEKSVQLRASMIHLLERITAPTGTRDIVRTVNIVRATEQYTRALQAVTELKFGVDVADWWAREAKRHLKGEANPNDVDALVRECAAMLAQM